MIGEALKLAPPNIDDPSRGDLWAMLQTGRSLRKLGKKDMYRLLRWGPMAVADLVAEFFETNFCAPPLPRAEFLARRWARGRRAAAWCCCIRAAGDPHPAGSSMLCHGGTGAITQAMTAAAKEAGAEIRTGAEVKEVRVKDGVRDRRGACRMAKRSMRKLSSPTPIRAARCSSWWIPRISRRTSS